MQRWHFTRRRSDWRPPMGGVRRFIERAPIGHDNDCETKAKILLYLNRGVSPIFVRSDSIAEPDNQQTEMSTFEEQLKDALSPSYEIERELGGGGMSRVFVATDRSAGAEGRR